jgi:hypothetical protein
MTSHDFGVKCTPTPLSHFVTKVWPPPLPKWPPKREKKERKKKKKNCLWTESPLFKAKPVPVFYWSKISYSVHNVGLLEAVTTAAFHPFVNNLRISWPVYEKSSLHRIILIIVRRVWRHDISKYPVPYFVKEVSTPSLLGAWRHLLMTH